MRDETMTKTATPDVAPRPRRRLRRSEPGDELLAGRAATGDDAAFTALYERYYGPLLGYTGSILLDGEDARDATQNALESALRALPARDASRPLRPWLYKIAHNEAITMIRRRRPQSELTEGCEPTVPGPEVDAEQRRRLAQLVDDLRALPERQRGALVMRELSGLSYDEIGLALGLSNEAARRAVCDARTALHDAVDGRATACASVRRSISDGDRRSLRARRIRAHLRSCVACASFQRSIAARRADLHALGPWISGAAVLSALGGGVGAGGGALLAGGGVSAVAGGSGFAWGSLPLAVKSLTVVAVVAGAGTAAFEIERAATPDRTAPKSQTAHLPNTSSGSATARRPATRQDRRVPATTRRTERTSRRTERVARSSKRSSERVRTRAGKPAPRAPRRSVPDKPAAAKPTPTPKPRPRPQSPAATSPASAAPAGTPEELAKAKLAILTEKVRRVIADAQALAASGTQQGFALAANMLQRTLRPLLASIDGVLAPFGLSATSSATAGSPAFADLLGPLRGLLDSVQQLLQQRLPSPSGG
jgi:RNA polymerase sigma factor (sigma-70 family)